MQLRVHGVLRAQILNWNQTARVMTCMQVRTKAPVKYCPNIDPAPLVDGFVVPPLPPPLEVEPPLAVVVVTPPGLDKQ